MKPIFIRADHADEFFSANPKHEGIIVYSRITNLVMVTGELKRFMVFEGSHLHAVWRKGDYYYDYSISELALAPDSWDMEDIRQGDILFRPL